jgi:hypothetical protein
MKPFHELAAAIGLCVALSPVLPAQNRGADATLTALQEVQVALHAAETAQIKLLMAGLMAGKRSGKALESVNRAVKNLTAAREVLRARLGIAVADPSQVGLGVGAGVDAERRVAAKRQREKAAKTDLPKPNPNKVRIAIEQGLRWLHIHQDKNGRWDSDGFGKHDEGKRSQDPGNPTHDVGVTGLALLAFLGDGNTTRTGPYKEVVGKAVQWLQKQQGANGLFGIKSTHDFIYDHSIAAFAMCEAYGISKDERLRKSAQAGVNYLESHRNPYAVWRYQPRDNDNDSSVTAWCLKAYRSAKDHGLQVNRQALKIGANFLDEITDPATGMTGYTKRGERSSRHAGDHARRFPIEKGEALTAAGLSTRFVLGQRPERTPVMKLAATRLLKNPPTAKDKSAVDHYYWFHGTSAMQQMGGRYWDQWSRSVANAILATQRPTGSEAGSWDSAGAWGEDGGRIYATSLLLNCLQVTWRDIETRDR